MQAHCLQGLNLLLYLTYFSATIGGPLPRTPSTIKYKTRNFKLVIFIFAINIEIRVCLFSTQITYIG